MNEHVRVKLTEEEAQNIVDLLVEKLWDYRDTPLAIAPRTDPRWLTLVKFLRAQLNPLGGNAE